MSDEVVFQEEQANTVSNISIVRGAPTGMLAWLVKNKVVANAQQAEKVLLIAACLIVLLAGITFFSFGISHPQPTKSVPGPNGTPIIVPQSAH